MQFVLFASAHVPPAPSKSNPKVMARAHTWGLLSRNGNDAAAEAAIAAVHRKPGVERISSFVDLVRKDERGRLLAADAPHETKEERGDLLLDVATVLPGNTRTVDDPILDDDGAAVLDAENKPAMRKVTEQRLTLVLA